MKDKTAILWYCIPSKQLQKFVLVLVQQRLVAWLLMATEICTLLVVYMLLIVVYATDTNETSSLQKDIHEAEAIENKEMKNTLTPLEKTQLITAENHYSFMKFRSTKQHDVKQLFLLSRGMDYASIFFSADVHRNITMQHCQTLLVLRLFGKRCLSFRTLKTKMDIEIQL